MTNINENVAIQFVKGKDERDLPEIRLFRNIDGKKGQAVYKFHKPSSITPENFDSNRSNTSWRSHRNLLFQQWLWFCYQRVSLSV